MDRGTLFAFFLLAGAAGAAFLLVPEPPWRHLADPAYRAVLFSAPVLVAIPPLRLAGRPGMQIERALLALFLASMPLIYVESCRLHGGGRWMAIELAGLLVFAGLAGLGLLRSPWFLAAGILAHGLLWDAWHHGRTEYIQRWYPMACLILDVGLAAYAALQVRRWQALAIRSRGCAGWGKW